MSRGQEIERFVAEVMPGLPVPPPWIAEAEENRYLRHPLDLLFRFPLFRFLSLRRLFPFHFFGGRCLFLQ